MIWALLIIYQLKHFLCDYPLQSNRFMLGKFQPGMKAVLPLAAHCGVHAAFTLAVVLCANASLWWLALVDFAAHFTMDFIKAQPSLMGRWKALSAAEFVDLVTRLGYEHPEAQPLIRSNTLFWNALGFDQLVHHLTHYAIIWMLVS